MLDALLRQLSPAVVGGALALSAYFQATGLCELLGTTLLEGTPSPPAATSVRARAPASDDGWHHATSAAEILARNPFDSVTGPLDGSVSPTSSAPAATGDPEHDVACDSGQVLLIVSSPDPRWSFATIASGSERLLRRQGDEVDGRVVQRIGWDRVWLMRDGARCQLRLGVDDPAIKPKAAASPGATPSKKSSKSKLPDDIASKIQKVSEREFIVDRSAVDRILEDQAVLMKSVRLVPERKDGEAVGLRISRVSPDSLLGVLGLQKGDRIRTLNGFSLTDPQKALEAYARLRTADKLTLRLDRGGKETSIEVQIK
jgi:general secretion pathway protein C